VIVGLGNPGIKYSETRHNIGYKVVNKLAVKKELKFEKIYKNYTLAVGETENSVFSLLLPLTYMNLSGIAVSEFHSKFNINFKEMLVVCDDINLPIGKLRLRAKGSHGGHKGLLSIINEINTNEFPRLRIGIGNNFDKSEKSEFVLSDFSENEKLIIESSIDKAVEICECFLQGGLKFALECYSKFQKSQNSNSTKDGVSNG